MWLRAPGIAVVPALMVLTATPAMASNDPLFSQQWALAGSPASINAPQAWCAGSGTGIVIADIDTGADMSHPDLAPNLIVGRRFTNGNGTDAGTDVNDDVFHGTMTTGLMVAHRDNKAGIAGVAPGARALIIKVLSRVVHPDGSVSGSGSDSDIVAGIRYATKWASDNGARMVINLSLGPDTVVSNVPLTSGTPGAVRAAEDAGIAVAVAAGNQAYPISQFATSNTHALLVGALARNGNIASYSNGGFGVNIYAPGGDGGATGNSADSVISTYLANGYASADGTSFAAPHVAGALALLMARGMSNAQAQAQVVNTRNPATLGLDAAGALGTSSGCATAPPTTNNPSHPPATGPTHRPTGGTATSTAAPASPGGSRSASPDVSASPSDVALATTPGAGTSPQVGAITVSSGPAPLTIVGGAVAVIVLAGAGLVGYRRFRKRAA